SKTLCASSKRRQSQGPSGWSQSNSLASVICEFCGSKFGLLTQIPPELNEWHYSPPNEADSKSPAGLRDRGASRGSPCHCHASPADAPRCFDSSQSWESALQAKRKVG